MAPKSNLSQGASPCKPHGFFKRMLSDTRGNALIITAAALFPILAMVGSGIDISRAYAVKGRLQQACDASALAIRRSMSANYLTPADQAEGRKFFDFNFPDGSFHTSHLSYSAELIPGSNEVSVNAAVEMPNIVMIAFGFVQQDIGVHCRAAQSLVNHDIVMVIDTTISMADMIDGKIKINSLKSAIVSFYDALAPAQALLQARGLRLRYGFVPYADHVNVGRLLYNINPSYIRNPTPFRTARGEDSPIANVTRSAQWLENNWTGCIDERDTDHNFDNSDGYNIPATAFDLQIDTMPNPGDPRTLWRFMDSESQPLHEYVNSGACTAPAQRLKVWTRREVQNFTRLLVPEGATYHDVGLVWGGRMLSNTGVFADSPDQYNNYPTNRSLIFMTDGILAPQDYIYSAYGVEMWDKRIVGSAGLDEQYRRHLHRYLTLCNAIKSKNISIWTISFDVSLAPEMVQCASNPDQASTSSNQRELVDAFQKIARTVAGLRLTR